LKVIVAGQIKSNHYLDIASIRRHCGKPRRKNGGTQPPKARLNAGPRLAVPSETELEIPRESQKLTGNTERKKRQFF
jgi:hypothetical protein